MTTKRIDKRQAKNILIHKAMQREFSLMLIGLLIAASFLVAFVIHFTIHEAAFGSESLQFGKLNPYQVIDSARYQLITRVTLILFVTLIIIAWYGITFLHRVAGPVYRFRQVFRQINRGEGVPRQFKIRTGDFFGETADEINKALDLLRDDHQKVLAAKEYADRLLVSSDLDDAKRQAEELKSRL